MEPVAVASEQDSAASDRQKTVVSIALGPSITPSILSHPTKPESLEDPGPTEPQSPGDKNPFSHENPFQ